VSEPNSATNSQNLIFFDFGSAISEFDKATLDALQIIQTASTNQLMPPENTQRFTHGRAWTQRANDQAIPGEIRTISTMWEIGFDDLIAGDLSLIDRKIGGVAKDMQRQFMEMMYATFSVATEKTGNVVDAKKVGSIPASFLEMLKKIEFAVDRDGTVRLPEIHTSPETGQTFLAALSAQPPEFIEEVERIKAEKTAQALKREVERKARFKRYPE
jgi:hypothetical protein